VEHEEPAIRTKRAVDLAEVGVVDPAKRGPEPDHDVDGSVVDREREGRRTGRVLEPRAELAEPSGLKSLGNVDEQDVSSPDRSQRLECPWDLPLDVQCPGEASGDVRRQVDR